VLEQIRTTGDRVTDLPLSQIGGDGVFVTEIERALQEGRVDIAVHSLKDLPTIQPQGLTVLVAGEREDVRDVWVSYGDDQRMQEYVQAHAPVDRSGPPLRVGTGSLRRTAQVRHLSPNVEILPLRGNVDTRLRKLEAGEYDGIVLAAAGLHRLGLQERLAGRLTYLPLDVMLPAPGQGALALECRDEPALRELLAPLQNTTLQAATLVERTFMRHLGAGCYLPVAAYAEYTEGMLAARGLVISLDGARRIFVQQRQPWTSSSSFAEAEQLGIDLAEQALAQGADAIIRELTPIREQEQSHV